MVFDPGSQMEIPISSQGVVVAGLADFIALVLCGPEDGELDIGACKEAEFGRRPVNEHRAGEHEVEGEIGADVPERARGRQQRDGNRSEGVKKLEKRKKNHADFLGK